jgi:hypothetical protein
MALVLDFLKGVGMLINHQYPTVFKTHTSVHALHLSCFETLSQCTGFILFIIVPLLSFYRLVISFQV